MTTIDFECLVIGAGVVGLACAAQLSKRYDTLLLEAEERFGKHTSSRNSEVLHSGIYYPSDTLKARLCVEGNRLARTYFHENGIPFKEVGKYVVAVNEAELPRLHALFLQGQTNGVPGLKIIDGHDLPQSLHLHPVKAALWVPSAAILDSHCFMASLERLVISQGGTVVYNSPVQRIESKDNHFTVGTEKDDSVSCRWLINCAGLNAHQISAMAGIDPVKHSLQQHWCKGVYFQSHRLPNYPHLIYPIPPASGQSLGIHLTVNMAGQVRFGPDTEFVDRIGYHFPEGRLETFKGAIARYLDMPLDDLAPDDTGIRAKLQGPDDLFRDFYIHEESAKGRPRFINCLGIESPGLTSCLAIAKMVDEIVRTGLKPVPTEN